MGGTKSELVKIGRKGSAGREGIVAIEGLPVEMGISNGGISIKTITFGDMLL